MTNIISVYEARKLCSLAWDRSLEFFTLWKELPISRGSYDTQWMLYLLKGKRVFSFWKDF